jgi:hypothetical protein
MLKCAALRFMIEQLTQTIEDRIVDKPGVVSALGRYLETLLVTPSGSITPLLTSRGIGVLPDRLFETLASREFCSLSLGRVTGSRDAVVASVKRALRRVEPIHFYYGLGGGYATSFRSGTAQHASDVGLGELLLLRQVMQLAARVGQFYPVGVRFSFVIDNLGAYLVESVPVTDTLAYCRQLRRLINDLGLQTWTDLIVTSEYFSVSDFAEVWPNDGGVPDLAALTNKPHRPAGRQAIRSDGTADPESARRCHAVRQASERLLAPMIRGVHLTERTTQESLGFRPYPGGDSGLARGEVVLTRTGRTALGPMLLTGANHADYHIERFRVPGVLPPSIADVGYAERVSP